MRYRFVWTRAWFALTIACGAPSGGGSEDSASSDVMATTTMTMTTMTTTMSASETSGEPEGSLRLNHLQALGTHNSYHLSPGALIKDLDYTHRPLDEQLGAQGVRQFELDIHFGAPGEAIAVYHLEILDTGSTCADLVECLRVIKTWSDAHLEHHPIYVMIEIKSSFDPGAAAELLSTIEEQVLSVWPRERLIVPDQIQGAAANLREGLAATGWPAIDELRGRLLLVMHDGGAWRDAYTQGGTSTTGRLLFPDAFGVIDAPFAAVHSINDPIGDLALIQAAVDVGHLVRTRADADNAEPSVGDDTRQLAALMSGAHFISTDYPPPKGEKFDYVCTIPQGTPSRCNPRSAPEDCSASAIEDPLVLGP